MGNFQNMCRRTSHHSNGYSFVFKNYGAKHTTYSATGVFPVLVDMATGSRPQGWNSILILGGLWVKACSRQGAGVWLAKHGQGSGQSSSKPSVSVPMCSLIRQLKLMMNSNPRDDIYNPLPRVRVSMKLYASLHSHYISSPSTLRPPP